MFPSNCPVDLISLLVSLDISTIRESSRDSWSYERMLGAVVKIGKVSMSATRSRGSSGLTVKEKKNEIKNTARVSLWACMIAYVPEP